MSQFPLPFVATMPPYTDSQYIRTIPPMMENNPSPEFRSTSPHGPVPPSPSSSTAEFKVSKAKKGKRVHACEFAGCAKVFTRAEHRRRHELSHRSKKTYTCSYEGCAKAFHRADYLVQHMARQVLPAPCEADLESSPSDPEVPVKSPLMRSNSTSSAVSTQQSQLYSKSPLLTGYQSPAASVNSGTPHAGDQSLMMCSNCLNCHNRVQGSAASGTQLFNYSQSSNMSLFGSQASSSSPPGLDAIDQYLRSILRPEAFLPAVQTSGQMNSSFWNNIDPNLPAMNTSGQKAYLTFKHRTKYRTIERARSATDERR
ncbi:uncharacterized protein N7484_009535 [Penicillium longicatenatum]|uniref:uncharacterized protein n=1 Tax=Penicillium longicatenatum TaxID=1561947 RepID=UPI00254883DC|nr:uncharacterized protein N7484_009535 [Penicillium longicatenatum]KAJ5636222.1 hypothetical protein N7484_009535 [Penicillium longicatenatum]